jgi:hypothetical protein
MMSSLLLEPIIAFPMLKSRVKWLLAQTGAGGVVTYLLGLKSMNGLERGVWRRSVRIWGWEVSNMS